MSAEHTIKVHWWHKRRRPFPPATFPLFPFPMEFIFMLSLLQISYPFASERGSEREAKSEVDEENQKKKCKHHCFRSRLTNLIDMRCIRMLTHVITVLNPT